MGVYIKDDPEVDRILSEIEFLQKFRCNKDSDTQKRINYIISGYYELLNKMNAFYYVDEHNRT